MWQKACMAILLMSMLACGGKDSRGGSGEGDGNTSDSDAQVGISGFWRGVQTMSQLTLAEPISRKVEFTFSAHQKFKMRMVGDDGEASGTFTDLQKTKNLILEIAESAVPSLGLKGAACDFSYELVEDELILKSEKISYKLKRSIPQATKQAGPLAGEWLGIDLKSNDWRVVVDELGFTLTVTKGRVSRSLMMAGPVKIMSKASDTELEALLSVERATPKKAYEHFRAELREGNLSLYPADSEAKKLDELPVVVVRKMP